MIPHIIKAHSLSNEIILICETCEDEIGCSGPNDFLYVEEIQRCVEIHLALAEGRCPLCDGSGQTASGWPCIDLEVFPHDA